MRTLSVVLISLVLSFATGMAKTIHVPADHSKIQQAIEAAAPGDVVLVQPGLYIEKLDFLGKSIVVKGTAPADSEIVAETIVDADSSGSVVSFTSGEGRDAVLSGLTLTGGSGSVYRYGPSGMESFAGGGVYCEGSGPTIDRCVITRNNVTVGSSRGGGVHAQDTSYPLISHCRIVNNGGGSVNVSPFASRRDAFLLRDQGTNNPDFGGGISLWHAHATVRSSIIAGNNAVYYGGGIYCSTGAELTLVDSEVEGNHCFYGGGGIHLDSDSRGQITDCSVYGHERSDTWAGGAAIVLTSRARAAFLGCRFSDNAIFGWNTGGGAVFVEGDARAAFYNCIFTRNQATGTGGAAYCHGIVASPPILFENCIFYGNKVDGDSATGGAITVGSGASIRLTNCTLTNNSATKAWGAIDAFGSAKLINCISWGNTPGELGKNTTAKYSNVLGGYPGEGNFSANPQFFAWHGLEFMLSPVDRWVGDTFVPRSDCIDAGDPALEDGISDLDPRWPRWYPNGARSDMGAYGGPRNSGWLTD